MSIQSSVFAPVIGIACGHLAGSYVHGRQRHCLENKRANRLSGGETARMALARRIADQVWYFYKGKRLEAGMKEQVLFQPERAETRQFWNSTVFSIYTEKTAPV